MKTDEQTIEELIDVAFRENAEELELSDKGLTEVPESITHLSNLRTLSLRSNQLTTIPESIARLSNLTTLFLWGNRLTTVPESITRLPNLTKLDLSDNLLTTVPQSIKRLSNLTTLDLSRNLLTTVPESITRLSYLTNLDLSGNQLTTVPESIVLLSSLTTLDLGGTQLTTVPESITRLSKLTSLHLYVNRLTTVPESITRLSGLTALSLSYNELTTVPESITRLTNLNLLFLEGNQLKSVPESITRLSNLTNLDLSGNQLTTVPESLTRLSNLTNLDLSGNQLTTVPESITSLSNLTVLDLSRNQLATVPESILLLSTLTGLKLSHNQLTAVPERLAQMSLKHLELSDNPIVTPPIHVVKRGIEAIRDYYRQGKEEGFERLYEAKLLIVGEPGAGKTTLLRKIKNPRYKLKRDDSTKGIQTATWQFKAKNKHDFKTNVWDFGGQEIYHSTHQFFLTKRSAYVLVADNRAEDTDFYYWLNIIQLLGQGSPVVVVKNEKQDRVRDFSERQLSGQFSCFRQVLSTNLKTNDGFPTVVKEIQDCLATLPHIGDKLPKSWLAVRRELEGDARNWMTVAAFYDICDKHGFAKNDEKSRLSGYLHDLGVCLHFQENLVLHEIVILKPEWATEAVYKVLDLQKIQKNQGHFSEADLKQAWVGRDYDSVHNQLLELMIEFNLCYRVPGKKDSYIAPQLLSPDPPKKFAWVSDDDALLYYKYEFMPKGIVNRLIVALHDMIAEQNLVWRSGVVLERGDTRAQIVEDRGKREIEVRVNGSLKADLRGVIMYELERVHKLFDELKFVIHVPCACAKCAKSDIPHFFDFEILKRCRREGGREMQCLNSFTMVPLGELLREFERFERQRGEERRGSGDTYILHQENIYGGKSNMKINKIDISGGSVTFADRIEKLMQVGQVGGIDHGLLEKIVSGIRSLPEATQKQIDAQSQEFANAKTEPEKKSIWQKMKDTLLENGVEAVKDITVEVAKAFLLPKP